MADEAEQLRQAEVDKLRKELEFIKRALGAAETAEAYVTAARSAAKLAARAAAAIRTGTDAEAGPDGHDNPLRPDTLLGPYLTVRNMPWEWTWNRVKEMFASLGINVLHVDKAKSWECAIVQVADEETLASATEKLTGHEINGKQLSVDRGSPPAEEMAELQERVRLRAGKRPAEARGRGGGARKVRRGG